MNKIQFLNDEEIKLLIKEYQKSRDIKIRNKIIDNYYFLVRKMAEKVYCKYKSVYSNIVSIEDFIQWGVLGLMDAVEKYNRFNIKFLSYSNYRISGNMIDGARKLLKFYKRRKNKKYLYSLEDLEVIKNKDGDKIKKELYKDNRYNPEKLYFENIDKTLLEDFYNNNIFYNEKEKIYFKEYFFLNNKIKDIANSNQVSETLIYHAVKDLKNKIKRYYKDNYC